MIHTFYCLFSGRRLKLPIRSELRPGGLRQCDHRSRSPTVPVHRAPGLGAGAECSRFVCPGGPWWFQLTNTASPSGRRYGRGARNKEVAPGRSYLNQRYLTEPRRRGRAGVKRTSQGCWERWSGGVCSAAGLGALRQHAWLRKLGRDQTQQDGTKEDNPKYRRDHTRNYKAKGDIPRHSMLRACWSVRTPDAGFAGAAAVPIWSISVVVMHEAVANPGPP
jgi:hypothetical protein